MKKNREIKNKNLKSNFIKATAGILAVAGIGSAVVACNKTKTSETRETAIETTVVEETNQETIQETNQETIVTPELDLSGLDVTSNDSIHHFAEQSYLDYEQFYVKHGMTVQDIEEMILTINDRYVDEEGNLLITADEALNAYTNLATILKSDDVVQTIDNIHFYMNGDLTQEDLEEIELINNQPNVLDLIDTHIDGSEYTIESVYEYQEMRNNLISNLNAYLVYNFDKFDYLRDENIDPSTVMPYDTEEINNYLFHQEIFEYNNDRDDLDNVITNGYRWLIDTTDLDACNIASMVNPNRYVITDPETDIDLQINYKPYSNNRFRQYEIFNEADTVNYVINANYSGLTELIPEEVVTEYIRIMTVMPYTKHFADVCNIESQTVSTINEISGLTNENIQTLTLSN